MVETVFAGESGNNLFQYFLSFCISHEKKYGVTFKTHERGNTFKKQNKYFVFNGLKLPHTIEGEMVSKNLKEYGGHIFNWEEALNHVGRIKLNGFFQKYGYYKPYKGIIKKIILKHNDIYEYHDKPGKNDLVLHFRNYKHVRNPPVSYYEELILDGDYDTIWLVSKEINSEMRYLQTKYKNVKLKMGNNENDFLFICNATNIGISQSTFSWWAAFISMADKIFFPLGMNNNYLWYENSSKERIDLFVDDEERYIKKIIQ